MPVILRLNGFTFFFYSNEGVPREPAHIHVRNAQGEAKFWLDEPPRLCRNDGFDVRTLRKLARIVEQHQNDFVEAWNDYFG